jgi:hypothetical protein
VGYLVGEGFDEISIFGAFEEVERPPGIEDKRVDDRQPMRRWVLILRRT